MLWSDISLDSFEEGLKLFLVTVCFTPWEAHSLRLDLLASIPSETEGGCNETTGS